MTDRIETSAEIHEDAALPRAHEVHTEPGKDAVRVPAALSRAAGSKSPARWAYERLILYIQNFEKQLDGEHEVAMGFTGGNAGVIRIEGLGYFDPDIVTFYGTDPGGAKTQVIQHVSQLNVLLRALPKHIDQSQPRRIGFELGRELSGEEDTAEE